MKEIFVNPQTGDVWRYGDIFSWPNLAKTYEKIAKNGAEEFYSGDTMKQRKAHRFTSSFPQCGRVIWNLFWSPSSPLCARFPPLLLPAPFPFPISFNTSCNCWNQGVIMERATVSNLSMALRQSQAPEQAAPLISFSITLGSETVVIFLVTRFWAINRHVSTRAVDFPHEKVPLINGKYFIEKAVKKL